MLTDSSLHASSISGGSNIIRHRPCPKSLYCNRFRRNVGHHWKSTSKPPSSSNPTDIFVVREVLGCTLILPVILSFKFHLGFLIIGFGDTETPYWSRDSSVNLIGFCSKACRNQWFWIYGLGILIPQSRWWKLKMEERRLRPNMVKCNLTESYVSRKPRNMPHISEMVILWFVCGEVELRKWRNGQYGRKGQTKIMLHWCTPKQSFTHCEIKYNLRKLVQKLTQQM